MQPLFIYFLNYESDYLNLYVKLLKTKTTKKIQNFYRKKTTIGFFSQIKKSADT